MNISNIKYFFIYNKIFLLYIYQYILKNFKSSKSSKILIKNLVCNFHDKMKINKINLYYIVQFYNKCFRKVYQNSSILKNKI